MAEGKTGQPEKVGNKILCVVQVKDTMHACGAEYAVPIAERD